MYVPIAGDWVPEEAWIEFESEMGTDLISTILDNPNHGRSPSEIAHSTLNASYPHHARGGVLIFPTKKLAHPPGVSKRNPWAIGDDFSTRRKVMRRGKLATDAK